MKKFKLCIFIILITLIITTSNISFARFADMEYPPNSSGYADFTDEDAEKQARKPSK